MLDPQIDAIYSKLEEMPQPEASSLPLARQKMKEAARTLPAPEFAATDYDASGVPVRLYRPESTSKPAPLLIFLHGGGFVFGDLDTHDAACRLLVKSAGCAVLAVGYRLAPEDPFPAPLDDCVVAYRWALASARDLGLDDDRIALGGESAGATLAMATTLELRRSVVRLPFFQLLVHPVSDLTLDHAAFGDVELKGLTRPFLEACIRFYVGDADVGNPLISPFNEPDLSKLPITMIYTVEVDPFRVDGEQFALRLAQADNEVLVRRLASLPHAFMALPATIPSIRRAYDLLGGQVARHFARR